MQNARQNTKSYICVLNLMLMACKPNLADVTRIA